jgi:hypothetical protein
MEADHQPNPSVFVIFGAGGDLTWRKLVPALYNLFLDGWQTRSSTRITDVPFYLRTGKWLPARISEVSIQFRPVPHHTFPATILRCAPITGAGGKGTLGRGGAYRRGADPGHGSYNHGAGPAVGIKPWPASRFISPPRSVRRVFKLVARMPGKSRFIAMPYRKSSPLMNRRSA